MVQMELKKKLSVNNTVFDPKDGKNNDEFLKKVYGDYMQIPPVEKRVNHAPLVIQFEGEEPIYGE